MIDGRVPSAKLTDVVEPFFLGDGADTDAGKEFAAWAATVPDVKFHKSVEEMGQASGPKVRASHDAS